MTVRFGLRAALLGLVSTLALAAPASAERYASGNSWVVSRNDDDCNLIISYNGSTTLFVNYTVGTNTSAVIVTDPAFKSVKADQTYPVEIHFLKGPRVDDGWGKQEMRGMIVGDVPGIGIGLNARDLLADLKASDALVLTRDDGDVVVEYLNLKGSALAISKLEQCSLAVHRQNPADPFA